MYTYDSYGRVKNITYPSGFIIKNNYDSKGNLLEIIRKDNNNPVFIAEHYNARGQITEYQSGYKGLTTTRTYDMYGFPSGITTGNFQKHGWLFDPPSGNLLFHTDIEKDLTESFHYNDALKNRLNSYQVNTNQPTTVVYSPNGNIEVKSDVGTYNYSSGNPYHGLKSIQPILSPPAESEQNISYTYFNKVCHISHKSQGYDLFLTYGPDDERVKTRLLHNGSLVKTKYFIGGSYELEKFQDGSKRQLHYIDGTDGLSAIYVIENFVGTMYYVHKDYLGSILYLTDDDGTVVESQSFDPWGRRRNPSNWTYDNILVNSITDRGYTGHEHLDEFDLINMKGRVYDPFVSKFLSADNFIQATEYSQNLNRYSYCLNNPLSFKDPHGDFFWFVVGIVVMGAGFILEDYGRTTNNPTLQAVGAALAIGGTFCLGTGFACAAPPIASSGFFGGFLYGGVSAGGLSFATSYMGGASESQALESAGLAFLVSGVISGMSSGISSSNKGLDFFTGMGVTECETFTPNAAGEPTNVKGTEDLTNYTYDNFPGSEEYSLQTICGEEQSLPKIAQQKGYYVVDDIIYNKEGEPVAGITCPTQWPNGPAVTYVSADYKDYTGYLKPLLGHELIHSWHYYNGFMSAYGGDASDFYAYRWNSGTMINSFNQSWNIQMTNSYGFRFFMELNKTIDLSTWPLSRIYPSWVSPFFK